MMAVQMIRERKTQSLLFYVANRIVVFRAARLRGLETRALTLLAFQNGEMTDSQVALVCLVLLWKGMSRVFVDGNQLYDDVTIFN
jgi:hypothetical protein